MLYWVFFVLLLAASPYLISDVFPAPLHGFAFWFDVDFIGPTMSPTNNHVPSLVTSSNNHSTDGCQKKKRGNPNENLILSTAPEDPPTHWQQVHIHIQHKF